MLALGLDHEALVEELEEEEAEMLTEVEGLNSGTGVGLPALLTEELVDTESVAEKAVGACAEGGSSGNRMVRARQGVNPGSLVVDG